MGDARYGTRHLSSPGFGAPSIGRRRRLLCFRPFSQLAPASCRGLPVDRTPQGRHLSGQAPGKLPQLQHTTTTAAVIATTGSALHAGQSPAEVWKINAADDREVGDNPVMPWIRLGMRILIPRQCSFRPDDNAERRAAGATTLRASGPQGMQDMGKTHEPDAVLGRTISLLVAIWFSLQK